MPSASAPALPYSTVNRAVNEVIFDGRFKLAPVYLDIEGDVEADIAARLGVGPGECLDVIARSVAATMKWNAYDPFLWHASELRAWNELGRPEAPPFSALLAVLSLAAERMRADSEYSAQNYYERLFEVLDVTTEGRKSALRQQARSVLPFWQALNHWLAENDFEFGRPTANQINQWAYVGYALSQALVRDADRKRLHGLFADYGLAPKEILTIAEMSLYLHEWMGGSSPSAWLKKIWASPELRARVAEAACSELEAWEGASEVTGQARRRLTWAAAIQDFPARLRLLLSASMGGPGQDQEGVKELTLAGEISPAAKAAFEGCPEGVQLAPLPSGGISAIEPVASLALSPLMLASFELEELGTGLRYQKAARAIIPLVKLDTGPFYREVSRLSFLRPHLVLCHVQWLKAVESHLTLNARQGFKLLTPKDLAGLAEDWVLFTKVELLKAPYTTHANLQALVPLSEGVSVEASGGLRLAGGLWHADAPPEITAAGLYAPMALQLHTASGEIVAEAALQATACRLTLTPDLDLDASDLTLSASEAGKVKRKENFSFRSAEHPRRLPQTPAAIFDLSPGAAASLISAVAAPDVQGARARGLLVEGVDTGAGSEELGAPETLIASVGAGDREEDAGYRLHSVEGLQETCVLRGHHIWHCEDFKAGDDPRDDKWMTCNSCSNRVLTRNRGRPPKFKAGAGQKRPGQSPPAKPPGMAPRQKRVISPEIVFDALCYLGQGSWPKFQDLAGTGEEGALAVHRMAHDLFALGHIDFVYDARLRTPVSWSVAPPVLCLTGDGAFLAGFRNKALVEAISERLAPFGELQIGAIADAPARYFWPLADLAFAAAAIQGVVDLHGRQVHAAAGAGLALASAAPSLAELASALPAVRIETAPDLQCFDAGKGSWRKAEDAGAPGAYRAGFGGRRYFLTDAGGAQVEGPYPVIKLLAAKASGLKLHGYDPARREFYSVPGCEPPGLLGRALVSFTGLPPARSSGRVTYGGVPAHAARLILTKLYG